MVFFSEVLPEQSSLVCRNGLPIFAPMMALEQSHQTWVSDTSKRFTLMIGSYNASIQPRCNPSFQQSLFHYRCIRAMNMQTLIQEFHVVISCVSHVNQQTESLLYQRQSRIPMVISLYLVSSGLPAIPPTSDGAFPVHLPS